MQKYIQIILPSHDDNTNGVNVCNHKTEFISTTLIYVNFDSSDFSFEMTPETLPLYSSLCYLTGVKGHLMYYMILERKRRTIMYVTLYTILASMCSKLLNKYHTNKLQPHSDCVCRPNH